MDQRIPHDNNKLEDDGMWRLIHKPFCRSAVPLLPQTENNSSKNEDNSIDFEQSPPNQFTQSFPSSILIYLNKWKQMYIAGKSSSHSTSNKDYLAVQSDCQYGFVECPPNPGGMPPISCAKKDNQSSITGNMLSHLHNNELHRSNQNRSKDLENARKEIVRSLSSFVLSTDAFLGISYNIWSILSSVINDPPLQKERDDRLSIWPSLLGLFGFVVFVSAVAVMNLVGATFSSMQKVMLIFWVILLYLQSANSIIDVFVTLVGALFMVWYAFGEEQPSKEVI